MLSGRPLARAVGVVSRLQAFEDMLDSIDSGGDRSISATATGDSATVDNNTSSSSSSDGAVANADREGIGIGIDIGMDIDIGGDEGPKRQKPRSSVISVSGRGVSEVTSISVVGIDVSTPTGRTLLSDFSYDFRKGFFFFSSLSLLFSNSLVSFHIHLFSFYKFHSSCNCFLFYFVP